MVFAEKQIAVAASFTNLQPSRRYSIRVSAINSIGTGSAAAIEGRTADTGKYRYQCRCGSLW